MSQDYYETKFAEACERIQQLPPEQRTHLMSLLEETKQRHHQMKDNFDRIHTAVNEMQLLMKYLIFDRDATRRERDDLRRRLEEKSE
jgi:hypothetical protein